MSSSLTTDVLQSLLASDSFSLNERLSSLELSRDDLLVTLAEGISNSSASDESLLGIAKAIRAIATSADSLESSTVQTTLNTVQNRASSLTRRANQLAQAFEPSLAQSSQPFNSNDSTRAVFAFANSIFSTSSRRDRIQPLLRTATETYQSFIPATAAAFSTVARNGQRIDNGRSSQQSLKWNNTSNGSTNITFAFDNSFSVNGLSFNRAKSLVVNALSTWAQYSPLNFQEIQDPGNGDRVDIYVQSERVDGRGGTLAYAYFPTIGDITFDNSESWNETKFLETAVHELGHSLGLGHEGDVSAIMNPVLDNKFAGRDDPFLLQDDINGVRYLYGEGRGRVSTLGQGVIQPQEPAIALPTINLVNNGSFEDTPVPANSSRVYSRIKGWNKFSGVGFQVDRSTRGIGASDGTAWVELDVYGENSTIYQNIDTVTGQDYTLSVDFTTAGRNRNSTRIEVFWEGKKVDTLTGARDWQTYEYRVEGGDRSVSTLAFRSIGAVDSVGGFIDNISVTARSSFTDAHSHAGHFHSGHARAGHARGDRPCGCSSCSRGARVDLSRGLGRSDTGTSNSTLLESASFMPELIASETQIFPDASTAV